MNSFSINRFGKTLRWVLCTNFRSLLMWTIGAALVVFMCEMAYWKLATSHNSPFTMLQNFGEVGTVLFVIASVVLISSVVAGINDKRKRESFMMLPSTNAEKYLSLIVYSTVVCILCVFLAMVLGDTLRMAFLWGKDAMFGPRYEGECYSVVVDNRWWFGLYAGREVRWFDSTLPLLVFNLLPDYEAGWSWYGIMHVIVWFVSIIWIHSLYTLGGTLLRKYAFVVASVVFILLVVGFAKIMNYYDLYMLRSEGMDQAGNYSNWHIGLLAYFYTIVLPILSIANYWISFRIFKGFELITNKWFNYDFHK